MSVHAAGGPLTPGGVQGTRDSMPGAARWQLEDAFGAKRGPERAQVGATQLRCQQNTDAGSASPRQRLYRPARRAQSSSRPRGQPHRGWRVIQLLPDLGWCARVSRPAAHFNFRFSWVSRGARLWTRGTWATGAIRTEGRTSGSPQVPRGENGNGRARARCSNAGSGYS